MVDRMTDQQAVTSACRRAQALGVEISDGTARTIAAMWHGGQDTAGYRFASTGAIEPDGVTAIWRDLGADYSTASADDRLALDMLGTYLLNRANRGPVAGWAHLWVRAS
jgi:hypothetical protein